MRLTAMESKAYSEMDSSPPQQDRTQTEGNTEANFLKDLYTFMKKRDTPIERIPHLGFKQIDLNLMYQTVASLAGYEQVTAQQLWKQVYNTLGGNPRSTSAATCTRRHYEKLLLPYECHCKGISMKVLSPLPQRSMNFMHYREDGETDVPRPAKRKMMMPLHQADPRVLPMHLHPSTFFHFNNSVRPPTMPIAHQVLTSYRPQASQPSFTFPSLPMSAEDPIKRLRYIAEEYISSTGLPGPLNLVKSLEERTYPSSFSAVQPSKNPKFLNTPYPLYTAQPPRLVTNHLKEDKTEEPILTLGAPEDSGEYVIDLTSKRKNISHEVTLKNDSDAPKELNSPIAEPLKSSEMAHINLLPGPPQEDKMEIEIPLTVFNELLLKWGPLRTMQGLKQLQPLIQEKQYRQRTFSENNDLQANRTYQFNSQQHNRSLTPENLVIKKVPSPLSPGQVHGETKTHSSSYQPSPVVDLSKASREVSQFTQRTFNKNNGSWDISSQTPVKLDYHHSHVRMEPVNEARSRVKHTETVPSAVQTGESSPDPMLQLTKDEVMKLKRMISSSF